MGRVWGVTHALSVTDLKKRIDYSRENLLLDKSFLRVKYIIDDITDEVTVLRHTDVADGCRGRIVGGRCATCNDITPGVLNWSFEITIRDIEDSSVEMCVPCYKGCGASLFKMSPAEFEDFPADKQADLKETWCGVPVLSGAMLMFDDNGDHAKIFLYNLKRLPEQYLVEEEIKK